MTGIERLRELIKDYRSGHECEGIECGELSCGECIAKNVLEPIANQIESEQAEAAADHAVVASVASEMERHVLGHEGMEDSPVARWTRELRAALGGEERDPSKDVSMSAYDLLPEEDREAIAWVREHGGMDALDRRLMPEGMEEMIARYPRYEDGTPALPGMDAVANSGSKFGEAFTIRKAWLENGSWHLSDHVADGHYWHWKHKDSVVKRPAKVLDADGVEIEVGDDLYSVEGGLKLHVGVIDTRNGKIATAEMYALDKWADPAMYTHRAPVLAADGKPLREGEKPYRVDNGNQVEIRRIDPSNGESCVFVGVDGRSYGYWLRPGQLIHERPDSWERLEEDATIDPRAYCSKHRLYIDPYDGDSAPATEKFARDLVRRARALAERGQ